MNPPQRIAVTGSSGLIGTALVGHLRSEGHTVQRLVRRNALAPDEIAWDPKLGTVDLDGLAGVDAVIHLAGVGVGDKRWTAKYKSEILNSRLLGTTAIAQAVAQVKPQVFISASAMGWYGETGNRAVTERDRGGDDFLATVCREWEAAADLAGNVRTVKLRTGLILDPTGGALGKMIPTLQIWFRWSSRFRKTVVVVDNTSRCPACNCFHFRKSHCRTNQSHCTQCSDKSRIYCGVSTSTSPPCSISRSIACTQARLRRILH